MCVRVFNDNQCLHIARGCLGDTHALRARARACSLARKTILACTSSSSSSLEQDIEKIKGIKKRKQKVARYRSSGCHNPSPPPVNPFVCFTPFPEYPPSLQRNDCLGARARVFSFRFLSLTLFFVIHPHQSTRVFSMCVSFSEKNVCAVAN